jgi:hypothetical protein
MPPFPTTPGKPSPTPTPSTTKNSPVSHPSARGRDSIHRVHVEKRGTRSVDPC